LMAGRCLSEQVEHRISQRMLPVTTRPRWLAGFKPSSHLGAHVAWKRQTDGAEKLVWPCVALSSPGRNPKRIGRRVQCGNWRPLSRLSANGWSKDRAVRLTLTGHFPPQELPGAESPDRLRKFGCAAFWLFFQHWTGAANHFLPARTLFFIARSESSRAAMSASPADRTETHRSAFCSRLKSRF